MHIEKRTLNGQPLDPSSLPALPIRSGKIEEIFRRVKRRVEAQ